MARYTGEGRTTPPSEEVEDLVGKAVAFILRSTAARPQTEAEIIGKLRNRQVPRDIAEAALARAKSLRAVDDVAFARAWVCDRGIQRGYGAARLREELRRRLVPDSLIEEALTQVRDRDDLTVATNLAREWASRLPRTLSCEAKVRRICAYLTRRGYPIELAEQVAWSISALEPEPTDSFQKQRAGPSLSPSHEQTA
jgi:regulatory protein